jgi:uncharacterized membrane protein YtjA (UPF0391 family)
MEYGSIFRNTDAESWPVREKPGTISQPDFKTGLFHTREKPTKHRRSRMLRWALGFFIVALIAALLGFTGISVAAAEIAKILFYLFLILFLVTLMGHLLRRS